MFIDEGMDHDSNTITISTEDDIYIDDIPAVDIQNENHDILFEIKNWALTENVTAKAVKSLLLIMRKYFKHLPADPRTLLSTPRSTCLRVVEPGVYYHFGLKNCIINFLKSNSSFNNLSSIDIIFNTDGLPLSKSSSSQLWPILGSVIGFKEVFVIGLYHSFSGKPKDVNTYFHDFLQESKLLVEEGLIFNSKNYTCRIKMFVADSPAKAFALCIKHHSGYSSCTKCYSEGEYVNHRICFPDVGSVLRTDTSFIEKHDDNYHRGETPLVNIPHFGHVTNVPLDYMHLVCLGVVKKLINLWFEGPLNVRIRSSVEKEISFKINEIRSYIPIEFQRKPRPLNEYKHWKAVEFRTFLLYIGPIVLKNKISMDTYQHFLTLHVAITILCSRELTEEHLLYAKNLLEHFVITFKIIYGVHNLSHNVHGLIHLAKDCEMYGSLDAFSAFRFENHMQQLLKLIRTYNYPIQQVVRRLSEIANKLTPELEKEMDIIMWSQHKNGPVLSSCHPPQFKKIKINGLTFTANNSKDWCCRTSCDSFVLIENIAYQSKQLVIIGKQFLVKFELYKYPCKSSYLNIYKLRNLSAELKIWKVETIVNKYFLYKVENGTFAAFPMIHSEIGEKQNI